MRALALHKVLGDSLALIQLSRKGLSYHTFKSIVLAGPFTIKEWSSYLHLTERTLQRYKKNDTAFETIHAERILEIAKLQQRGKDIFGSLQNFDQWTRSKNIALGGLKPKEFLDSIFGIEMLNDELTRIEHGVLA